MGKKIITLIMLISCSRVSESKKIDFEHAFKLNDSIPIKENVVSLFFYDAKQMNDSLILFTDAILNGLFSLKRASLKISKISSNGEGPGEYDVPRKITIQSDTSFWLSVNKDYNLRNYDSNGNNMGLIKLINRAESFTFYSSDLYFTNYTDVTYSSILFNSKNEKFIDKKNCFKIPPYPIILNLSLISKNGNLYFFDSYENLVYKFNPLSKSNDRIKLIGIQEKIKWEDYYDLDLTEEKLSKLVKENNETRNFTLFDVFTFANSIFLVLLQENANTRELIVFNEKGLKVSTINIGDLLFYSSRNNNYLFLNREKNRFELYHIIKLI